MSVITPRGGGFVLQTTSTASTGTVFFLAVAPVDPITGAAWNTYAQRYADGETVPYVQSMVVGGVFIWEAGYGVYSLSANSITPSTPYDSSSTPAGGTFVPVPFTGTRTVTAELGDVLSIKNLAAALSPNQVTMRTALGLGTVAILNTGIAIGNAAKVIDVGSGVAGIDRSLLPSGVVPSVPSGATLPFYNSAVPSGYTLVSSIDDMVMCVTNNSGVGGAGPHAGGSTGGISWDVTSGVSVANHTLTASEIPSHTHTTANLALSATAALPDIWFNVGTGASAHVGPFTSDGGTGGGGGHSHTLSNAQTWRPKSAYFFLGTKI